MTEKAPADELAPKPLAVGVAVGAAMGRYRLVEQVGQGGMGVVFATHDPELQRPVAVKVLRPDVGGPGSAGEQRLRREGQTMARLTHPNVIRVYDVGVQGGAVFVAMEYVAGGTLKDWLAAKTRRFDEILEVFVQAGRGLTAAHEAGLVHRDFKPSNVLVSEDGRVLVTDFGLARMSIDGDGRWIESNDDSASPLGRTVTRPLNDIAEAAIALHDRPRAIAAYERALAVTTDLDPLHASVEFELAKLLRPTAPSRAVELGRAARALFVAQGAEAAEDVAKVDAWLGSR